MLTFRFNYFLYFLLILVTEVCIALFVHDVFIRPFFGDFLASIFVYLGLRSFFRLPVNLAATLSLFIAYLVEILQYFKFLEWAGLQDHKFISVVLGTSFAWEDILAYTLGIWLVLGIEKYYNLNRSK